MWRRRLVKSQTQDVSLYCDGNHHAQKTKKENAVDWWLFVKERWIDTLIAMSRAISMFVAFLLCRKKRRQYNSFNPMSRRKRFIIFSNLKMFSVIDRL